MPEKKPKKHTVVRDTRSGKFVKTETAERRPSTTVTETIKREPKDELSDEQE